MTEMLIMKRTILLVLAGLVVGVIIGGIIFPKRQPSVQSGERKILYYRDPMNPQNTSQSPRKAPDGMDYVPVYAEAAGQPTSGNGIHIDPSVVQNIGVVSEVAARRRLTKTVRTSGTVAVDQRRLYSVNARVMGWVEKLYADYEGKAVKKGQPLFELYSPDLTGAQQEYLQAMKEKRNAGKPDSSQNGLSLWESAGQRLLNWGVSPDDIAKLESTGTPLKTMAIVSPADGLIMDKMIVQGQNIMAGMELYKIADLSTVWVMASVYQYEIPWVKTGQGTDIELSYIPGRVFHGQVSFVSPMLDMESRTAQVRIEVANTPSFDIKPGMFATVSIKSPVAFDAVAVPEQAIIHAGDRDIAVIDLGGGYFETRQVRLGVSADGYIQVLSGIKTGEKVVVSSQFLIDSESNLKAAVSQLSGHEGMNMPEKRNNTKTNSGNESMEIGNMPGMDMGAKPQKAIPPSKAHPQKFKADHGMDGMPGIDMDTRPDSGKMKNDKDTMGDIPGMDMEHKGH